LGIEEKDPVDVGPRVRKKGEKSWRSGRTGAIGWLPHTARKSELKPSYLAPERGNQAFRKETPREIPYKEGGYCLLLFPFTFRPEKKKKGTEKVQRGQRCGRLSARE